MGGRSFLTIFPPTCTCIIHSFRKENGKDRYLACSCEHWRTLCISGHENRTFAFVMSALLYRSSLSPSCSRWSRAHCDGACLDTAEINASSTGRCSRPAGGAAAGSVTTAACFAAPLPTAGRSKSFSCFFTSLPHVFTPSVFSVALYLVFHSLLTDTDVRNTPWGNYRKGAG